MLYLLNKDVRTARWNGEPLHEATSAIVKETMNSDFTLTVKYPISDSGIYQLIQEDMLIKAPTPVLGAQLFRIKKPVEHNDHLEITAYHISDDVMQRSITPVSVTSQSCGMALSRMVQNTKTALGDFSFNSDIQDRRTFNTTETETLYSVLLDGKHSIVGTWEGELVRDNFAMTVKKSRGENRGVVITTHKNLKDYQRTKNSQNVVTRIHAKSTFKPEGAEKETTIRVTVDSPLINSYPYINEKEYENNNAKSVEELQKWAQSKFSNEGIDKVSDAIKIEAYELDGQVVHMGDTVNLKSWKHNVDAFKKAIAYEFDALKEEYISLTFDDKAGTGGSRASGGLSSAADAILGVTESVQEIALEKALQNADLGFDHQAGLLRQEILDGIELAKAKTEEVKRELSDTINQRFDGFDNGPLQEIKRKAIEALQNAGASSLLAQEAKRIGLDSIAKLEEFKRQATSAQTALSGDLDALKRTVTSEVNQASEYRRTTTEALSRMTGQMEGLATKSEVAQGIDGLTQTFAKMKVGGRNLLRGSKGPFLPDTKPAKFDNNILYVGNTSIYMEQGQEYTISAKTDGNFTAHHDGNKESDNVVLWIMDKDVRNYQIVSDLKTGTTGTKIIWNKPTGIYHLRVNTYHKEAVKSVWDVKIEKGTVATDWSPAIEDVESQITEARTEFKQTADGLSTKMAAVETYVDQDNQRQESLRRYTREESAKQATAVRELVARDYVGKATHQEDVRGLERRFEAITNPQNGLIATQIANYKTAVDGRFADITSLIAGKANQTDFQRVKETSQLYERILGSTDNGIANNVARMAMTSQLFQVEVAKNASNGQNLLKGTKGFSGNWKNMAAGWKKHSDKYQGCDVLFKNNSWNGIGQEIDAKIGEIYTFSLWMKSDWKNDTVNFCVNRNGSVEKGWGVPSETSVSITSEWQRYSFTFKITKDGFIFPRVERLNQNTNLYVAGLKLEKGSYATLYTEAPEDTDEAIRTVQSQLSGSWAIQNINSAGSIVSQINATNNQILIEAEKIRLKGKTLLDELTAIQGYFKRLFVGDASVGTLNSDIIRSNSITADKLVMDMAMARRFVSSDLFTDTLAAKEAFINKLRSVVVSATLLEGFKGRIGGFQIGTHDKDPNSYWLTGQNQFAVGMGNGAGKYYKTALWVNWGDDWGKPGPNAWYVMNSGRMICGNEAEFKMGAIFEAPTVSYGSFTFYDIVHFQKNIFMLGGGDIYGTGSTPRAGGKNSVVWWNQVGDGSVKYHIDRASDKRLKENIVDSNIVALDKIKQLKMKSFDFISTGKHEEVGLIAQEVEAILPSVISKNPEKADDYLHIDYVAIVPYLIKSIQELNQKIEEMEKTVA